MWLLEEPVAPPMPSAGTAAQQNDHVAGCGTLTADIVSGSGSNHSAALQTLGNIAVMVQLGNMAGGQADLVAVGGIARRGGGGQLPLGQLALQGLVKGHPGIAAAGEAQA